MPKKAPQSLRGILTDTLPYEVPCIFTNDFLYQSELTKELLPEHLQDVIKKYRKTLKADKHTKPLSYQIRKGFSDSNTLGIIHPLMQLKISEFISNYAETIIHECAKSPSSLRAPYRIVPLTTDAILAPGTNTKSGAMHSFNAHDTADVDHAPSFFSLKKYNLLDKFFQSNELLRLEARFLHLATLDVSKCFFNIYTHSITWAAKDKDFGKLHAGKYSFENSLDNLMQKSNYNETAGIIVGPEFSRVFAEIIFQKIDRNVISKAKEFNLEHETDFKLLRYVDDFFIFSNDPKHIDIIQKIISDSLEEYKLFENREKRALYNRPFITNITLARNAIVPVCEALIEVTKSPLQDQDRIKRSERASTKYRQILDDLREVAGQHKSNINQISSPVFSALKKCVVELANIEPNLTEDNRRDFSDRIRQLLRILFYCAATDFRTPPLFRVIQITDSIIRLSRSLNDHAKTIENLVAFEVSELFSNNFQNQRSDHVSVEASNLLIMQGILKSDSLLFQDRIKGAIDSITEKKEFSYFAFITWMYVLGEKASLYKKQIDHIAKKTAKHLKENKNKLGSESEYYLLFSDFISCPHISAESRLDVLCAVLNVDQSKIKISDIGLIAHHFAFVDWRQSKLTHLLKRKRLQPVYYSD